MILLAFNAEATAPSEPVLSGKAIFNLKIILKEALRQKS